MSYFFRCQKMDFGIKVSREEFEENEITNNNTVCVPSPPEISQPTTKTNPKFKFQPKPFNTNNYKEYNRNELVTKVFAKNSKTTNLLNKLPDVVTAANAVQDRFVEIDQMEIAIKKGTSGSKTALQYLRVG